MPENLLAPVAAPPPRQRVLIVEDYKPTRELLGRLFARHDWEPILVADSIEAHPYIHSSVRRPPDVYLIDLKLPDASGAQLIRIIRLAGLRSPTTRAPVRIVAYTCLDADDPQVVGALAEGADAVVFKLEDFEVILAAVQGGATDSRVLTPPRRPGGALPATGQPPSDPDLQPGL